jgi:aminobenzoyl-glutamate transport protein
MSQASESSKTTMQKFLDLVEKVGNKVPHPVIIFLTLIAIVIVLSAVLSAAGTSISYETIVPISAVEATTTAEHIDYDTGLSVSYQPLAAKSYKIETRTVAPRSLLTTEGIRFIYSSLIPNFMGFTAVGLMIVAMVGAGVAEESGLVKALIRKLVMVSPGWALTYILAFVGIVSSIAADAGYLVLIPLAGTAFLSVGRHPLAGLALGFAAVASAFTVNMLIKPLDAVLVEFTNDAIHLVDPDKSIGLASNLWFSIASVLLLSVVVALITEKIVEPRLGAYKKEGTSSGKKSDGKQSEDQSAEISVDESRGLWWAFW